MRTKAEINSSQWFGAIPNGWKMVPLSVLFRFSKGLSITKSDLVSDGSAVISYGQIHSKENCSVELCETLYRYVPASIASENQSARVFPDGFVFADTSEDLDGCGANVRNGSCRVIFGGYHTIVLNPRKHFNSKFLAYLFSTQAWRWQIRRDLVDVKLFSVNQTSLNEVYVVIPPEDTQRHIVSFLDKHCTVVDNDIAKRREVVEKLKEYKKSLIARAVTKGIDPNVKMKDSGIEWIGSIPASWNMKRLIELASPVKNKNKNLLEQNLLSLSYGNIVRKNIEKVSGLVPASYEGYNIIEAGDTVLRFTDLQNDQKSLRTGLARERGIVTSAYQTIRPIPLTVIPDFLHSLLHVADICKVFYNMGDGMRQSLNWCEVSRMLLPVPSLSEQKNIIAFLNKRCASIDEAISRHEQLIKKLVEYRKSIIHHAVTGKIDCTEK